MMVEAEATDKVIELVEGGAQAPTETVVAEGLEAAKPFIAALCTAQQELADAAAKPTGEYPVFPDYGDDVYYSVASVATDELADALTIGGKAERDQRTDEIKAEVLERLADTYEGREKEVGAAFRSLTKKLVRQRILDRPLPHRRPGHHRHPRVVGRGRGGSAGARQRAVRARRNPDPGCDHARHGQDGPADRLAGARDVQALHAPLQLPAVLHRRDRPRRIAQAARDRARRARRARPDPRAAERRRVPVRHPPGLRGAELQRLDVDGLGLCVHAGAAERRRAAEGSGRRHRDGPGLRRRRSRRVAAPSAASSP